MWRPLSYIWDDKNQCITGNLYRVFLSYFSREAISFLDIKYRVKKYPPKVLPERGCPFDVGSTDPGS